MSSAHRSVRCLLSTTSSRERIYSKWLTQQESYYQVGYLMLVRLSSVNRTRTARLPVYRPCPKSHAEAAVEAAVVPAAAVVEAVVVAVVAVVAP